MSVQEERPDPTQLAAVAKELSDDDLQAQIQALGVDAVLAEIFKGMEERFLPEKAGAVDATVQYDIDTPEGPKTWTVRYAGGKCETSPGAADSPRLTLSLGLVNFVRLILNQVEGTQLFMTGKLRLQGDVMFAMQMQTFFDRNF